MSTVQLAIAYLAFEYQLYAPSIRSWAVNRMQYVEWLHATVECVRRTEQIRTNKMLPRPQILYIYILGMSRTNSAFRVLFVSVDGVLEV